MSENVNAIAIPEEIRSKIYRLPGRPPFMLAEDLADLYEVTPERVHQAVRRNPDRFPAEFSWMLTAEETRSLQIEGTLSAKAAGQKMRAFSHEGCNILSGCLRSKVADMRCVQIIRAFTAMEKGVLSLAGVPGAGPALPGTVMLEALNAHLDYHQAFLDLPLKMTVRDYLAAQEAQKPALRLVPPAAAAPPIPGPQRARLSREERHRIVELAKEGLSNPQIAAVTGRSRMTVARYLKKFRDHGPKLPKRGIAKVSAQEVAFITRDILQGKSFAETARGLKRNESTVRDVCRRAGVKRPASLPYPKH